MPEQRPSAKASRQPIPSADSGMDEDFASLFEASQKQETGARKVAAGDLIRCRVIALGQSSVFVSVGDKAEGTIDIAEFRDPATGEIRVTVGDEIQATVVDDGGRSGSAVLTRMLGRGGHAAAELEQACALGVPVEGLVSGEVKGGYEVHFGSVRAFCPGSLIDYRRGGERPPSSDYIGKRFAFRVTKVENDGRNVVVSRRDILEEEAAAAAERTWQNIRPGAVLDGTVRSIRDFGAFVDLGGVDGMIHISELAYQRVKHPGEVLEIGQAVRVQVLRVGDPDKDGRRQIALSLRALAQDPWETLAERFPVGSTVSGKVTRVEAYGAFVEIAPGVEGLVHVSKLSLDRRLSHARQAATVGQEVEVTVLGIDPAERRVSLSMVEQTRQARETEAADERRDQEQFLTKQGNSPSMGTFADLLDQARKK
jgi:small subunit ribosomal protein S1